MLNKKLKGIEIAEIIDLAQICLNVGYKTWREIEIDYKEGWEKLEMKGFDPNTQYIYVCSLEELLKEK